MLRNPDTWPLQNLAYEWERDRRGERSGVWNPHFYFRKSKMVGWETPEKFKKSSCSTEKNRNICIEQIHPHAPLLPFFGKRKIASERAFTWILLGVCTIKKKKKRTRKWEKATILTQWEVFGAVCKDMVLPQGREEGWWWAQRPGDKAVLSGEPVTHLLGWKVFVWNTEGQIPLWLTVCDLGFQFPPPHYGLHRFP